MGFNNAVFMSERETADRNFAMAYYMKENRCFPPKTSLHDIMDLYFQVDIHYLNGNNLFSIDYLEFLVSISLLFFLNCTIFLYFKSCSMEITTESLAVMGASIANGGICPPTSEKVLLMDRISKTRVLEVQWRIGFKATWTRVSLIFANKEKTCSTYLKPNFAANFRYVLVTDPSLSKGLEL